MSKQTQQLFDDSLSEHSDLEPVSDLEFDEELEEDSDFEFERDLEEDQEDQRDPKIPTVARYKRYYYNHRLVSGTNHGEMNGAVHESRIVGANDNAMGETEKEDLGKTKKQVGIAPGFAYDATTMRYVLADASIDYHQKPKEKADLAQLTAGVVLHEDRVVVERKYSAEEFEAFKTALKDEGITVAREGKDGWAHEVMKYIGQDAALVMIRECKKKEVEPFGSIICPLCIDGPGKSNVQKGSKNSAAALFGSLAVHTRRRHLIKAEKEKSTGEDAEDKSVGAREDMSDKDAREDDQRE